MKLSRFVIDGNFTKYDIKMNFRYSIPIFPFSNELSHGNFDGVANLE